MTWGLEEKPPKPSGQQDDAQTYKSDALRESINGK